MSTLNPSAATAPEQTADRLHEAVLRTLANAVISVRPDGVITTFNAAAAAITGIAAQEIVGRTFAEVFLVIKDAEDFTQAVLDSVYGEPLVSQRVIEADFGNGPRALSMSVSRIAGGDDAGVAVVFDDISELRELQAREIALAQEVDAQHKELRQAYLNLEEQNRTLAEASRRTRLARLGGLGAAVVLLTLAGLYALSLRPDEPSREARATATASAEDAVLTVEPQQLTETVTMTGQLAPLREVDIISPVTGKVSVVHVPFGARVEKDGMLLELDVTEARVEHRDAQARHIKAQERFAEVENWDESVEVSRARRSLATAKLALEDSRRRLENTAFLFERGVIPESEHTAAQRDFTSRKLDLDASEQDFASVLQRGESEVRIAKLELENARVQLHELSESLRLSVFRAPVAGVVMRPRAGGGGGAMGRSGGGGRIAAGQAVSQGDRLMTIGDLDGISIVGRVDETDVVRISAGKVALITGDAFAGTVLEGVVEQVSTEATVSQRMLPYFDVKAIVPNLTPEETAAIRLGMSAVLDVVVRTEPEAILIPLAAVSMVNRKPFVRVLRGEEPVSVPVVAGEATISGVEILEGIDPGDRILLPGG